MSLWVRLKRVINAVEEILVHAFILGVLLLTSWAVEHWANFLYGRDKIYLDVIRQSHFFDVIDLVLMTTFTILSAIEAWKRLRGR